MRKIIALGIMLLFLGMTISSTGLYLEKQSIKPVSFSNILYVGGSGPGNYTKIQDAINAAWYGDTVFVYDDSSPYYERVMIDKSINLIGENKDTTVIDGNNSGDVISIIVDSVSVMYFTIQNSGDLPQSPGAGVHISSRYNSIIGNKIINNQEGIYLIWYDYNIIHGNIITDNDNVAIAVIKSSNNNISRNIIKGSNEAIYLCESYNNIVSENIITKNEAYGFFVFCSNGNEITRNTISYVIIGIMLQDSERNIISCNNFINIINAYFIGGSNSWKSNYWNRPRLLPKIIFGFKDVYDKIPNCLNFDLRPALKPYDIGV